MPIPVCLFTYNRLEETKQTVFSLLNNYLASESEVFIFSDGARNDYERKKVGAVRAYLRSIRGFKDITIVERKENLGLANSIISGVSEVLEKYSSVIVLEDDLISSPNFLDFMNEALEYYGSNSKIFSVSGYTMNLPSLKEINQDYYLGYRASSWGWGTWKNRWQSVDWELKGYDKFKYRPIQKLIFMSGGSDLPRMLKNQVKGKIDSWAIRWCFDQFQKRQLTVFPAISKINNIGFTQEATHTKNSRRFNTKLDSGIKRKFHFDSIPLVNKKLSKEFKNKFSLLNRLKDKF